MSAQEKKKKSDLLLLYLSLPREALKKIKVISIRKAVYNTMQCILRLLQDTEWLILRN